MLNLFRRKTLPEQAPELLALRSGLFAMDDLHSLVKALEPQAKTQPPWSWFVSADQKLTLGQKDAAISNLQALIATPGQQTRIYLWAWHNLRALGVMPPASQSHQARGMVVETPTKDGRDVLAAYADHSARYFNFSGGGLVWDTPDAQINQLIDALLQSGRPILKKAQPWKKPEPGPPAPGLTRISVLTDFGLHFGQGPYKILARDNLGGPPLKAAAALQQALLERTHKKA